MVTWWNNLSRILPRGMAFIDFPNITSSGMGLGIRRLKFAGLAEVLTKDTRPVGVIAYIVNIGSRQELFRELDRSGLKVEPVSPGKSVDGRLIFDLIVGAQRDFYDVGILASGDRDYVRVVQEAKKLGKTMWVASFSSSIAPSLKSCADKFIDLDEYVPQLSIQMYPAICDDCRKQFEVPFKPISGRPLYCRNCYRKHRKTKSI